MSELKQKKFWQENAPNKLYRYDWLIALIEHGFSWTFMIMLPITYSMIQSTQSVNIVTYIIVFVINTIIHSVVDDLKCNRFKINLLIDQGIHIIQVIVTWIYINWRI